MADLFEGANPDSEAAADLAAALKVLTTCSLTTAHSPNRQTPQPETYTGASPQEMMRGECVSGVLNVSFVLDAGVERAAYSFSSLSYQYS